MAEGQVDFVGEEHSVTLPALSLLHHEARREWTTLWM
jgi:hypothetical protein